MFNKQICKSWIINHPLFADADTETYPYEALQYQEWTKAMHGIALLSVDKFQSYRSIWVSGSWSRCGIRFCIQWMLANQQQELAMRMR